MSIPYRITIEQYDHKCSVELNHSAITLDEYMELIRSVSLAAGWTPKQVNEIFNEEGTP